MTSTLLMLIRFLLSVTILVIIVLLLVKCNGSVPAALSPDQVLLPEGEEGFEETERILHDPTTLPLTADETLKSFRVPKGYHVELVASEPLISEPAAITWDANGRMYVAQLETYMQTVEGKNQYDVGSRVMLLEDTNNDGRMDKSTVFVDKLIAPRMILCVGDELLVNETNSFNIDAYRDTDNDGIAD